MRGKEPLYEQHEASIAAVLGGRLTCSSGRTPWDKGDVKVGHISDGGSLLLDAKCTQQGRYRLTHKVWHKLALEAGMSSRIPALPLRFLDASGTIICDYIVVPDYMTGTCKVSADWGSDLAGYSIKPDTESGSAFKLTNGLWPATRLVVLDLDDFVESRRM